MEGREAFRHFATRISASVNNKNTRFDKHKYKRLLSSCFTMTDEAFALLMVISYEPRWVSQHKAALLCNALKVSRKHQEHWNDAEYTSTTEGSRRGQSWSRAGVQKINSLALLVKARREAAENCTSVEEDLRDWCRVQGGLSPLSTIANMMPDDEDAAEGEEDENEVEAVGECALFEV